MNIAIIGNGQSALRVDWNKELSDKNLIVRLNLGPKHFLYSDEFFKIPHNACLNGIDVFKKYSYNQKEDLFKKYSLVYFLSFYDKDIIRKEIFSKRGCEDIQELLALASVNEKCIFKNLFKEKKAEYILRSFNNKFYNFINLTNISTLSSNDCVESDILKYIPSLGLGSLIHYTILFPQAKIFLYGFDFNKDTGCYWFKHHDNNYFSTHNFNEERKFIEKELSFFKNTHIIDV